MAKAAAIPTAKERIDYGEFDEATAKMFFGDTPEDTIDFIETLLSIPNEQGRIVHFKLYPQQRQMVANQTGRDITVKGRQTRASSLILARNVRRMVTGNGLNCLTLAQDDQITATFRARVQHHLRDLKQQGWEFKIAADNDNELVLEDTESRWIWGSGEERVVGRAYTSHIVHLSELSHYNIEKGRALMGGIQPSVPGPPYGWFDIESTPNGAEGPFYDMVMDSKTYDPASRWSTHFYSWWLEPRYRAGTTSSCDLRYSEGDWDNLLKDFKPTEEEQKHMKVNDLDVGQMIWRRVTKKAQDKTDAPFLQEYVETLDGCFLTKGGNYFASPDGINHLEQYRQTVKPPQEIVTSIEDSPVKFTGDGLHIWDRPQQGRPYAVWVDCAGGGLDDGADYSAVVVMDCGNMAVVARLAIKVAPQEIAPMAVAIAKYYNNALLGGERDAFGSVCVAKIMDIGYKNIWYWFEPGQVLSIKKAVEDPWGHPTQIRAHILSTLREHVLSSAFSVYDGWGVQQLGAFTWQKVQGREKLKAAGKGQKDDLVMCYAGLCYIANQARGRYKAYQSAGAEDAKEQEIINVGANGLVTRRGGRNSAPVWYR